jgi:predicted nucleic acid-binding protein
MTNYLLDTNHISPIVTIEHPLRRRIITQLQAGDTFSIAAPVLGEFLYGISLLPRAEHNLREWEYLRADFIYYSIDQNDAEQSAELRLTLRQRGWQLGLIDAMIAVIAVRNNLILLTNDKDFGAIAELKQENWR